MVVPLIAGGARLLPTLGQPFVFEGDHAILELGVRRALTGAQLLGPYSRFGWKQPGPAYFFLQSPLYWLTGHSSRALFLGALLINLGSTIAVVLIVRRHSGEAAARAAAALVGAYLVVLGPVLLEDAWNPYVLALPLLLTMVLAAAGAAGSTGCLAGAALVGSYVIQTHVGAATTCVVVLAVAAGLWLRGRLGPRPPPAPSAAASWRPSRRWACSSPWSGRLPSGSSCMAGRATSPAWPGSFWLSIRSSTTAAAIRWPPRPASSPARRRCSPSAATWARGVGIVPSPRSPPLAASLRSGWPALGLVVAGAVVAAGRRRHDRLVEALGLVSLAGTTGAVWATSQVIGPLYPYLVAWASSLLLPAGIGVAALARRVSPRGRTVLAALAIVPAVLLTRSLVFDRLPQRTASEVTEISALVGDWLGAERIRSVHVSLARHDDWPLAAGLLLQLQRARVRGLGRRRIRPAVRPAVPRGRADRSGGGADTGGAGSGRGLRPAASRCRRWDRPLGYRRIDAPLNCRSSSSRGLAGSVPMNSGRATAVR